MTSHCKRSYVSDVYQGSGYTPAPSRVCVLLCKTGFVTPTLQILKTGSVDSWLPYLAHLKHIQLGSCVLSNAQGSHVQVRSKCPVHYSWQANGGLGLGSLISCFITGPCYTKMVKSPYPGQSPDLASVYREIAVRKKSNICQFQPAGYAGHLRPGGSAADPHHELGPVGRDHHHLL